LACSEPSIDNNGRLDQNCGIWAVRPSDLATLAPVIATPASVLWVVRRIASQQNRENQLIQFWGHHLVDSYCTLQ
jgi:hypothetical protein